MQSTTQRAVDEATTLILRAVSQESSTNVSRDETDSPTIITAMDEKACSLRHALKVIQDALISCIAETNRSRNNHTLINRLPLELFVEIVHLSLEDISMCYYYRALHDIAQVSHRWNGIIQHTPSLWACVMSDYSLALTKTFLTKSFGSPLRVSFGVDAELAIPDTLIEACRYVHRWGHVDLSMYDVGPLRSYLETPAPLVKYLTLHSTVETTVVALFHREAPRLLHLDLISVSIPFHSPMLAGLRHLRLSSLRSGPSTSELLQILAASPDLSFLSLNDMDARSDPLPADNTPLVMRHLTDLVLQYLPPEYCSTILCTIQVPNCTRFNFQCELQEVDQEGDDDPEFGPASGVPVLHEALRPFVLSLKPLLQANKLVTFNVMDSSASIAQGSVPSRHFAISLLNVDAPSAFRWLADTFAVQLAESPICLVIEADFSTSNPDFLAALERTERVETIDFPSMGGPLDINPLFQFLRHPYNDQRSWRLPNLQTLTILPHVDDWSGLLPMIRSRYGKDETLGGDLPRPFIKMDVRLEEPNLIAEARDVLGNALHVSRRYQPPQYPDYGDPGVYTFFPGPLSPYITPLNMPDWG